MDDYEQQRRLSEAGVPRKVSDAVLTLDTDSFMVGERVWVGGVQPGIIAYIGETIFGPGDWAGVVLDRPVGKNSGTVGGHRYFQCEPKHGVFSRLTRLSREPLGTPERDSTSAERVISAPGSRRSSRTSPAKVIPPTTSRRSSSPHRVTGILAGNGGSALHHHHHHHQGTPPRHGSPEVTSVTSARVGDRVSVASASGRKVGTLRYIGHTEFADGQWAGIELDEPRGRNDGSVAGTRYFECRPSYGLFAPVHKVSLLQRRPSADPARRRSNADNRRPVHVADEDGYY